MRLAGKLFGVTTAVVFGSLITLAPEMVSENPLITASAPVMSVAAETLAEPGRNMAQLHAANDAETDTGIAPGTHGDMTDSLARLKKSDDIYFKTMIALGGDESRARHMAKLEAADDAYFAAAMAIEMSGKTAARLARLKAANDAYYEAVTALGNAEKVTKQLVMLKNAQTAYVPMLVTSSADTVPEDVSAIEVAESDNMATGSLPQMTASEAVTGSLEKELPYSEDLIVLEAVEGDEIATGNRPELSINEVGTETPETEVVYSEVAGRSEFNSVQSSESITKDQDELKLSDNADFEAAMPAGTAGMSGFMAAPPKVKVVSIVAAMPVVPVSKSAVSEPVTQEVSLKMPQRHATAHTAGPKVLRYKKVAAKSRPARRRSVRAARAAAPDRKHKGPLRWFFKDVVGGLFYGSHRTAPGHR